MAKQDNVNVQDATPVAIDYSKLSVKELSDILAQARAAEKAKKEKETTLPMFAYLVVMADSKLVYWSGRSETDTAAREAAKAYAMQEGGTVHDMCTRPLPQPRGRKAKATS